MKQAILITAYKDVPQLIDIIKYFHSNVNFYIHIDKKSKVDIRQLRNLDNVFVYSKYVVNWGGLNHLRAILLLVSEAIKNNNNAYFHLITGQDFPVKPVEYFTEEIDISKNYLEFFELPDDWWERIEYYNLYDFLNAKINKQKKLVKLFVKVQQKLNIKRGSYKNIPTLYGGSTYWSLNRAALEYVLKYTNNNNTLLKRLRYTFCAEEIYFQTIIMNSPHADDVVNDNLRFIDWNPARAEYPACLDATDFSNIIASNKLFARKFDIRRSSELKVLLTGYLQKQA